MAAVPRVPVMSGCRGNSSEQTARRALVGGVDRGDAVNEGFALRSTPGYALLHSSASNYIWRGIGLTFFETLARFFEERLRWRRHQLLADISVRARFDLPANTSVRTGSTGKSLTAGCGGRNS